MNKMTEGSITKHLLSYAIPTILGNFLQLAYNAVDSIVVSKFMGKEALAAVSVANPIMTIVILGASGISFGASVFMSKFYGANDEKNLKREFSTTLIFGFLFSLLIFAFGMLFSRNILTMMDVPAVSLDMAETYLRIIFVGFLFTFQYNIIAAALRSIGDAKTPVIFLGIGSVVDCILDFIFAKYLQMGVVGAALSTVIAEALAAILCFIYVYRTQPLLRLKLNEFVVDKLLLKETLKSGSLTALQQAGQPIGKALIQSVINGQGIVAIGAFNAVSRMDDFACIPAQSIGHSIMTCTAQNRGAEKHDRVQKTFRIGLVISLLYFPIICIITLLFRGRFVKLLSPNNSEDIVAMGVAYLGIKAFFFIMPCILNAIQGYFRGMNRMRLVLVATLIQISVRTVLVYILVPRMGIVGEAYACLTGWLCQMVFEYGIYIREQLKLKYV